MLHGRFFISVTDLPRDDAAAMHTNYNLFMSTSINLHLFEVLMQSRQIEASRSSLSKNNETIRRDESSTICSDEIPASGNVLDPNLSARVRDRREIFGTVTR